MSAAEQDEARARADPGAGRPDRGLQQHVRAGRPGRVEPRARRGEGVREGRAGGGGPSSGHEHAGRAHPQARSAHLPADRALATHVPLSAGDPHRRQLRRSGEMRRFFCLSYFCRG